MNEPSLDPAIFNEMRELMDDALGEFIQTYLANSPRLISQMELGLSTGNAELIQQNAHQLKGGSGSIGAMRLYHLAQQIEQIARDADLDAMDSLLQQLKQEFANVDSALREYT